MNRHKPLTLLTAAGVAAVLAAPAGAAKPADHVKVPSASKQCRTERAQMGETTFKLTYGTGARQANAFGKCVSARNAATRAARKAAKGKAGRVAKTVRSEVRTDVRAARACREEKRADPAAFATRYGTNANHRNAFGKCVSAAASRHQDNDAPPTQS
jgi:hypothetical protein